MDLDALLEESVELRKKEKAAKPKKEPAEKSVGWMNSEEREIHQAAVKAVKASGSGWKTIGALVMINVQCCQHCGNEQSHLEGIFLKRTHKKFFTVQYHRPSDKMELEGLDREVEINRIPIAMCPSCLPDHNWPSTLPTNQRELQEQKLWDAQEKPFSQFDSGAASPRI